jgi:hypothetical protein
MPLDSETLEELRASWNTVRLSQAMVQTNLAAGAFGLVAQTNDFRDLTHGLILLFAVSVMEEALERYRDQGLFAPKRGGLKELVSASKDALPWVNWEGMGQIRNRRNDVAHHLKYPPRAQAWADIDSVEKELIAWGVLSGPVKAEYTITRGPAT